MIEESTSDLAAEGLHIDADELYDEAFRRYCHIARAVEGKDMSWLSLARYEKMEIGKIIRILQFSAHGHEHIPSIKLLARIYAAGHGVSPSDEKAAKLWEAGARLNDANCQCEFGLMREKGRGMEQNDREAAAWYAQAAAQGLPRGSFLLGKMTEEGRGGIDRSDVKASLLYQQAAPSNVDAHVRLHQLVHTGLHYYLGWSDMATMAEDIIGESEKHTLQSQRVLDALSPGASGDTGSATPAGGTTGIFVVDEKDADTAAAAAAAAAPPSVTVGVAETAEVAGADDTDTGEEKHGDADAEERRVWLDSLRAVGLESAKKRKKQRAPPSAT